MRGFSPAMRWAPLLPVGPANISPWKSSVSAITAQNYPLYLSRSGLAATGSFVNFPLGELSPGLLTQTWTGLGQADQTQSVMNDSR